MKKIILKEKLFSVDEKLSILVGILKKKIELTSNELINITREINMLTMEIIRICTLYNNGNYKIEFEKDIIIYFFLFFSTLTVKMKAEISK